MSNAVRDWMSKPVVVIDPDASVSHALTLMRRRKIHSLVVDLTSGARMEYGIVTSTDIRDKIVAAERNPAETTVREIMSAPVIVAQPDWTLKQCSTTMQAHNIHHLPVADQSGTLVGLISATDLFMAVEERGWGSSAYSSSSSPPIILAARSPIGSSSPRTNTSRVLPPVCSRPTTPISRSSSISRAARG